MPTQQWLPSTSVARCRCLCRPQDQQQITLLGAFNSKDTLWNRRQEQQDPQEIFNEIQTLCVTTTFPRAR